MIEVHTEEGCISFPDGATYIVTPDLDKSLNILNNKGVVVATFGPGQWKWVRIIQVQEENKDD